MPVISLDGVIVDSFAGSKNGRSWRCVSLFVQGVDHPYKFFFSGDSAEALAGCSVGTRHRLELELAPASKGGFFVNLKGVS